MAQDAGAIRLRVSPLAQPQGDKVSYLHVHETKLPLCPFG
jgi:hypothetical protein